jgi:hypothetical protein
MVRLQALVVLGLGVLMLRMLLIIVQQIWHPPASTIQPGIVSLLVALGVHAQEIRSAALGRSRATRALVKMSEWQQG